jgi:hypothetical protein
MNDAALQHIKNLLTHMENRNTSVYPEDIVLYASINMGSETVNTFINHCVDDKLTAPAEVLFSKMVSSVGVSPSMIHG